MSRVIITGGGTAGHTNPGIATAQALVSRGLRAEDVHFVGGERGNEGTIVPAAGFTIDLLPGRGLRRSMSAANVGAVIDLIRGTVRAFGVVRSHRPQVVLCLGGYAAFGASFAAVVLRVPVVVTEQNARASVVNRVVGRFAKACAIPFPDTDLPSPVLTGNPVRPAVVDAVAKADRASTRRTRAFEDKTIVVAVWSGSLGARSVNRAVRELAEQWRDRTDITIHHIVGRRDWPEYGNAELDGAIDYRTIEYEDDMPTLLVASDVAVCRSGASTVTELAIAGLPSLLVPLPGAPRDHQRANSRELAEAGGAIVIDDDQLSGRKLADMLEPIVNDDERRKAMAEAARSVGRPGAADAVAALVLRIADGDGPPAPDAADPSTNEQTTPMNRPPS